MAHIAPTYIYYEYPRYINFFASNVADQRRHSRLPTTPTGDLVPSVILFKIPYLETFCCVQGVLNFYKSDFGYSQNIIGSQNCTIEILENVEASYGMMSLAVEMKIALRKQICQKMGSERVKGFYVKSNGEIPTSSVCIS